MAFQRKLLRGRHVVENSRYRAVYENALGAARDAPLFDLRRSLAILQPMQATDNIDFAAAFEATVTKLMARGDCPKLNGRDGRRWA